MDIEIIETGQPENKKPHKKLSLGRKILIGILLVLMVLIIGGCVKYLNVNRDAGYVSANTELNHFDYVADVTLDYNKMDASMKNALIILGEIEGVGSSEMKNLHLEGTVFKDKISVMVYPSGSTKPVAELFLTDGEDYINGTQIINSFRGSLFGNNPLINSLVPEFDKDVYMTLRQLEALINVDTGAIRYFQFPFRNMEITRKKAMAGLFVMHASRKGDLRKYTRKLKGMTKNSKVELEWKKDGNMGLTLRMTDIVNPAEALKDLKDKLSKVGMEIEFTGARLNMIEKMSVEINMGNAARISEPSSAISDEQIEALLDIQEKVKNFFLGF